MITYPKIQTIYTRNPDNMKKVIIDDWSLPVFDMLKNIGWRATEKIDGTNIRVGWNHLTGEVEFAGRTDNAMIPSFLLDRLKELFLPPDALASVFPDMSVVMFGEAFGDRIQKVGSQYIPDGVDFALFDVWAIYPDSNDAGLWLNRDSVEDIADRLRLRTAPVLFPSITLPDMTAVLMMVTESTFGEFPVEGVVLVPCQEMLLTRRGQRVIGKLKMKDLPESNQ